MLILAVGKTTQVFWVIDRQGVGCSAVPLLTFKRLFSWPLSKFPISGSCDPRVPGCDSMHSSLTVQRFRKLLSLTVCRLARSYKAATASLVTDRSIECRPWIERRVADIGRVRHIAASSSSVSVIQRTLKRTMTLISWELTFGRPGWAGKKGVPQHLPPGEVLSRPASAGLSNLEGDAAQSVQAGSPSVPDVHEHSNFESPPLDARPFPSSLRPSHI